MRPPARSSNRRRPRSSCSIAEPRRPCACLSAGAGSATCAATVDQPVYLIQLPGNSSRAASPDDVRHALTAWKMWNWTRAAGVQLAFDLDPGTVDPTPSQMAVWKKVGAPAAR